MIKAIDVENDPIHDHFLSGLAKKTKPPKRSNRTFAGSVIFTKKGMSETARIDFLLAMHAVFSEKVRVEDSAYSSKKLFNVELSPVRLRKHIRDCQFNPKHFYRENLKIEGEEEVICYSQKFIAMTLHNSEAELKKQIAEAKKMM